MTSTKADLVQKVFESNEKMRKETAYEAVEAFLEIIKAT